jgi:hypothetical protein
MASPKPWDWTNGHVQRETGTDSLHCDCAVTFSSGLREWRLRFRFPLHIYNALGASERERCRAYCQALFERMYLIALLAGERDAARICLEEALRTYIDNLYRGFVRMQIQAGNKKWLVPGTIQKNVLEEN